MYLIRSSMKCRGYYVLSLALSNKAYHFQIKSRVRFYCHNRLIVLCYLENASYIILSIVSFPYRMTIVQILYTVIMKVFSFKISFKNDSHSIF